jgi:ATP-binding cassette subfamily F protein 3
MLQINKLHIQLGNKLLFDDASATVFPNHKVAIVGANGCGKSTLFSAIKDQHFHDSGEIQFPKGWRLAWVKQETPAMERSALDYVIDGHHTYRQLSAELEQAENENNGQKIAHCYHELENINAFAIPSKAGELLNGLGFSQQQHHLPVSSFSGGWRMRLNLAQALLVDSDCLLLDEPTNHLDLDAVIWLEKWLAKYSGTILLISHDRDFIDNICNSIIHVENCQLNQYTGNYSNFERQRSEKLAQQQANYEKQQAEIKHIQSFVDRFKAKASKAKQAQSRIKMLERMEQIAPAHIDSQFHFEFKPAKQLPNPIIKFDKVAAGYDNKPILKNIKLNLVPGSRIGLLGKNGAGKSTLIKTLAKELTPLSGDVEHSKHLKIGYFCQHQLEQLTKGNSPVQHLKQLNPALTEQEARNYLGSFGFNGDQSLDVIDAFSGGEKARLVLALLVYQQPNLLLMDEPTNHLDIEMRQALTIALQSFDGAMILISHDRHLLKASCDDLYLVDSGSVTAFNDDLEGYHQWLLEQNSSKEKSEDDNKQHSAQAKKEQKRIEAEMRKELSPIKKQADALEKQQAKYSNSLAEIEETLADTELYNPENKAKLTGVLAQQTEYKSKLEELELAWFECEEQIEQIKAKYN